MERPTKTFKAKSATVHIFNHKEALGAAAADEARLILHETIAKDGKARVIIGTGPSQADMIRSLVKDPTLNWRAITVFHMDEYVGMACTHPASFRLWLKKNVVDVVHPGQVNYLEGDAADINAECERYAKQLNAEPITLSFIGFGENGHIAFNDPHAANFKDAQTVKRVWLDNKCRMQQVREGHFKDLASTPVEAISITCPALMRAAHVISCVPDRRKAEAVKNAIEGPLTHDCPASVVFTHPRATIYLDAESASLLSNQ